MASSLCPSISRALLLYRRLCGRSSQEGADHLRAPQAARGANVPWVVPRAIEPWQVTDKFVMAEALPSWRSLPSLWFKDNLLGLCGSMGVI